MAQLLSDRILLMLPDARKLYHRLLLVVAPPGSGKTGALAYVHETLGHPLLNLNLELSRRMLDVPAKQRPLRVAEFLDETLAETGAEAVLVDNIEILFDAALMLDPLCLLQTASRHRTVVVAWNGSIQNGRLTYAAPGHPEFRHYPAGDLLVVAGPESGQ